MKMMTTMTLAGGGGHKLPFDCTLHVSVTSGYGFIGGLLFLNGLQHIRGLYFLAACEW